MTGGCWPHDRRAAQVRTLRIAVQGRPGWQVLNLSAWTAHAVFRAGRTSGVVVGTASGWWWGVQYGTQQVVPMAQTPDLRQACLLARREAYRTNYRITRGGEINEGDGIFVGVRDGRRRRHRATRTGTGTVRSAAGTPVPADGPGTAAGTGQRCPPVAA